MGRWTERWANGWRPPSGWEPSWRSRGSSPAGLPLPRPLVVEGAAVVPVGPARFRVYEWVDLAPPLPPAVDAAVAAEAGRLLGRMHRLDLPAGDEVDPWYRSAPTTARFRELAAALAAAGDRWADPFAEVLGSAERLRPLVAGRPGPARVCHRDFDPQNVLPRTSDGSLVILDWENVGALAPDEELAAALLGWCSGGGVVEVDSMQAFLDGYRVGGGEAVIDPARSFSMAACTTLNFLAVMAEQALAHDEHRAFADDRLATLCGGALEQLSCAVEQLRDLV